MRTVVVTGAAGTLGSHLVRRLLSAGNRVRGVDLRGWDAPQAPAWSLADVRDTGAMHTILVGADALVHCASALPSYPAEQIRSIIVDGASSVFTAAARAGVSRVVHISSTAVYGLPAIVPTSESHPRQPVDTYGAAKAAAEEIAERCREDGVCLSILRPKTFLGPGRMGLFSMLFEWAEEGHNFPVLGTGDVKIQMLGLDDLVDAVMSVLDAPDEAADDTYNLGAARFGTLREDFQAVLDAAGHGKRVIGLPARPALAVLRAMERLRLSPVYGRLLDKLLADSYVSIDKAGDRLGFAPRLSNQDAILRTYAWWKEQRHASDAAPARTGRTSGDPWRQGLLAAAKHVF